MNKYNNKHEAPTYKAIKIGDCAYERMQQIPIGQVVGVTSKGIFIQNQGSQIIFITGEKYHGPLTLNLASRVDFKDLFSVGERCMLEGEFLHFQRCEILIHEKVIVWHPPSIEFTNRAFQEAKARCLKLTKKLIETHDSSIFIPFMNGIAKRSDGDLLVGSESIVEVYKLLPSIRKNAIIDISEIILGLIGHGPGLTPAGDDFICGYVLASFYLCKLTNLSNKKHELLKKLKRSVNEQTTNLSAQLIYCAILGKADERLLNSLRWIAQGGTGVEKIKEELLSYGSSSGIDSHAGILFAMIAA